MKLSTIFLLGFICHFVLDKILKKLQNIQLFSIPDIEIVSKLNAEQLSALSAIPSAILTKLVKLCSASSSIIEQLQKLNADQIEALGKSPSLVATLTSHPQLPTTLSNLTPAQIIALSKLPEARITKIEQNPSSLDIVESIGNEIWEKLCTITDEHQLMKEIDRVGKLQLLNQLKAARNTIKQIALQTTK